MSIVSENESDSSLVEKTLAGDRSALESIVGRYKDWIFNVSIRMVMNPADAEDVMQEVLIKIMTHLDSYDKTKASFKTWLYRITVNHILNMKTRGYEKYTITFDNYYSRMDTIQDRDPIDTPEIHELVKDTMTDCVMATLVCLDRLPRLVIILGVIMNVDSKLGAQLLEMTPVNFRKILSRSRKKLKQFMSEKCSLANPQAECRCKMRIMDLIDHGYRNPQKLIYSRLTSDRKVRDVVGSKVTVFMNSFFYPFNDLLQSQPYWNSPEIRSWLDTMLGNDEFKDIFHIN
jgi:RNA polymerase sigma factor (sigma-70 family)